MAWNRILLADSIRSMQNVGALFRNADGASFQKLILTWHSPHPPRNDITKTALWAEKNINWEYFSDPIYPLKELKKKGYKIYSVELNNKSNDYKTLIGNTPKKMCLVLGNEISWVQKKILDISDEIIMIPMNGIKESLNVSVAAGIVMYASI